jgi:carboxypeptidase D
VKRAIHAPLNVTWNECSGPGYVFGAAPDGKDTSLPSALSVLPRVIEKSKRTVVANGLADFVILSGGTRIAIQKYVRPRLRARAGR